MKKQIFNPIFPLDECIPDGEPHVFGDRVYVFGSHDKLGGETFCMEDYTCYSAPVNDLTDWKCHGTIYKAQQDPDFAFRKFMYAPDVVQGNDGKFYLYYCMSGKSGVGGYFGPVSVAVSDGPALPYKYLGFVRNPDGSPMKDYVCFDPAVMNDDGTIRLYYGTQYAFEEESDFFEREDLIQTEMSMFGKSREEIVDMAKKDSAMGAVMVTLQDDMLTVRERPHHIIPYRTKGTAFEAHPFFEASSIRKAGEKYYFIYSSMKNHELCYATSDFPDRDFVFGGTIVSNGDVGLPLFKNSDEIRTDSQRLNMTGTTHGSIERINGRWYVFYHRLTHKSDYSRQACAEEIRIADDGSIAQIEITSCGLNGGPLLAEGSYPAAICCNLSNGKMPHGSNKIYTEHFPNVGHEKCDGRNVVFVKEISDGTLIGYKYFDFGEKKTFRLRLKLRGRGEGVLYASTENVGPVFFGKEKSADLPQAKVSASENWSDQFVVFEAQGIRPLYLYFLGSGDFELLEFEFFSSL